MASAKAQFIAAFNQIVGDWNALHTSTMALKERHKTVNDFLNRLDKLRPLIPDEERYKSPFNTLYSQLVERRSIINKNLNSKKANLLRNFQRIKNTNTRKLPINNVKRIRNGILNFQDKTLNELPNSNNRKAFLNEQDVLYNTMLSKKIIDTLIDLGDAQEKATTSKEIEKIKTELQSLKQRYEKYVVEQDLEDWNALYSDTLTDIRNKGIFLLEKEHQNALKILRKKQAEREQAERNAAKKAAIAAIEARRLASPSFKECEDPYPLTRYTVEKRNKLLAKHTPSGVLPFYYEYEPEKTAGFLKFLRYPNYQLLRLPAFLKTYVRVKLEMNKPVFGEPLGKGAFGSVVHARDVFDKDCKAADFVLKSMTTPPHEDKLDEARLFKILSEPSNYYINYKNPERRQKIVPHIFSRYLPKFLSYYLLRLQKSKEDTTPVENITFIAMDYNPFIRLKSKDFMSQHYTGLKNKTKFTLEELYALTVMPWHALDALHSFDYLHNDIKEDNMIFTVDPDSEFTENPIINGFKFLDLGFVLLVKEEGIKAKPDGSGLTTIEIEFDGWRGTEDYCHPEHLAALRRWDEEAADIARAEQMKRANPNIEIKIRPMSLVIYKSAHEYYSLTYTLWKVYTEYITNPLVKQLCFVMLRYMSNGIFPFWIEGGIWNKTKGGTQPERYHQRNIAAEEIRSEEERKMLAYLINEILVKGGFKIAEERDVVNMSGKLSPGCI